MNMWSAAVPAGGHASAIATTASERCLPGAPSLARSEELAPLHNAVVLQVKRAL